MKPEPRPRWASVRHIPAVAEWLDYPFDRRTLCIHEAGHAVLMLHYNICPFVAEVSADLSGRVAPPQPETPAPTLPTAAEQWVATRAAGIYYAGRQAELLLHGISLSGVLLGDSSDCLVARKRLWEAFGNGLGPMYYSQRLARSILSERWEAVERIAEALADKGCLDGRDLKALFSDGPAGDLEEAA